MTDLLFFIDQHGCAKNQVDGEIIISLLSRKGFVQTFDASKADLIIVNSCGFIESAKTESLNAVLSARENYPKAKILLAGCLAERYSEELKNSLFEADGFFGNGDLSQIENVAESIMRGERTVFVAAQKGVCSADRNLLLSFQGSAYVKITEGCDNHCAFCAIPLIRGSLRSRRANEIVDEIKTLVSKGVYEINLVGQDLASYGRGKNDDVFGKSESGITEAQLLQNEKSPLCSLLEKIREINGTFCVRLLYIHPDHFCDDIFPVMKSDSRFLPYFDIPFQSGDDKIISAMNRTGSASQYESLVEKIRREFPESAIRTTFLTGFPGETDEEAENTAEFLRRIQSDWSGCFVYSKEEKTPAAKLKNFVPKKIAQARARKLGTIQAEITKSRLLSRCGKTYDVLIEEVLQSNDEFPDEGIAIGRAWFQAPEVDGNVVVHFDLNDEAQTQAVQSGRLVRAHVTSSTLLDLNGTFESDSPLNSKIKPNKLRFAQNQNA